MSKKTRGICMGFYTGMWLFIRAINAGLCLFLLVSSGFACDNGEEFGLILLVLLQGDKGNVME